MTRSTCLPPEILAAIFEKVDDLRDLRHVRMASRTLCATATPFAFRALSVITTSASAQNLGRLFDIPNIAAYIREVSYHDTGPDERGWFEWMYVRTIVIRELESSLSRIHQLPLLEAISLRFNPVYKTCSDADLDGQGRAVLQASILGALATSFSVCAPSKLTSLSLHNLRSSDPPALETFPFQAILASLQRLQLSVLFDCASVPSTFFARWCHFWSNLLPHTPAVPIQTQLSLTELTLHSDEYVGALCGLSLRELDFPSLSVLSLRSIVFDPILGAEDFILRHASTLARLELLDCKVLMSANRFPSLSPCTTMATGVELGPSIYWDRIWDRFAAKLTALVMLYVDEPLENPMHSCTYFRYVHRRVETYEKYVLIYGDESRVMADHAALQRFYITVAASARSKEGRVEP